VTDLETNWDKLLPYYITTYGPTAAYFIDDVTCTALWRHPMYFPLDMFV